MVAVGIGHASKWTSMGDYKGQPWTAGHNTVVLRAPASSVAATGVPRTLFSDANPNLTMHFIDKRLSSVVTQEDTVQ